MQIFPKGCEDEKKASHEKPVTKTLVLSLVSLQRLHHCTSCHVDEQRHSPLKYLSGETAKLTMAAPADRVTGAPHTLLSQCDHCHLQHGGGLRKSFILLANQADCCLKKMEGSHNLFSRKTTLAGRRKQMSPHAIYRSECDSDLTAVSQRSAKITHSNRQEATDSACIGSLSRSAQTVAFENGNTR